MKKGITYLLIGLLILFSSGVFCCGHTASAKRILGLWIIDSTYGMGTEEDAGFIVIKKENKYFSAIGYFYNGNFKAEGYEGEKNIMRCLYGKMSTILQ
ncbi:MAG TPA: hypothetical protein ENH85_04240 [Candidatus Scalindua sp.]|nr:hypothetical protein [Candidatus Scalindua sp.]